MAFSYICRTLLDNTPKFNKWWFPKDCHMKCETISIHFFVLCSIKICCSVLALFKNYFVISHIVHFKNVDSMTCANLSDIDIFHCTR